MKKSTCRNGCCTPIIPTETPRLINCAPRRKMGEIEGYLSLATVAAHLGVKTRKVKALIHHGPLKASIIGGKLKVYTKHLREFEQVAR